MHLLKAHSIEQLQTYAFGLIRQGAATWPYPIQVLRDFHSRFPMGSIEVLLETQSSLPIHDCMMICLIVDLRSH
jgi:hypothetical protein